MAKARAFRWPQQLTPSHLSALTLRERDPRRALAVLDAAASSDPPVLPLPSTVAHVAGRLAAVGDVSSSVNLLRSHPSSPAVLAVLRALARARRPLDAVALLRSTPKHLLEAEAYTAVAAALLASGRLLAARAVLCEIRAAGLTPTLGTHNVILKALCAHSSIESAIKLFDKMPVRDACSYNTLIDGLCRNGQLDKARKLFREICGACGDHPAGGDECALKPTVVTYTTMIHWVSRAGEFDEAANLLNEMREHGLSPNVVTYSSLIDGFCKGERSRKALELLDQMVKEKMLPTVYTYSSVIDGLCKEGRVLEAMEVLDRMRLEGRKPDVGLFGKIIFGLCDKGRAQEAANLLDEMVLAGVKPDRVTWSLHLQVHNAVLTALCSTCCKAEMERAFMLYQGMKTRGITLEASTYSLLVEVFCTAGVLDKAGVIVHNMLEEKCLPNKETWDAVVVSFCAKTANHAQDGVYLKLIQF